MNIDTECGGIAGARSALSKGDAHFYVANLLDNKGIVANKFAVEMGLNYNSQADSIVHGIEIAAAVTPVDTTAAIRLIGVAELVSI